MSRVAFDSRSTFLPIESEVALFSLADFFGAWVGYTEPTLDLSLEYRTILFTITVLLLRVAHLVSLALWKDSGSSPFR